MSADPATPERPARRLVGLGKRHKPVLQGAVLILITIFLCLAVWKSWSQLRGYSWDVQWSLVAAAFMLFVLQELSFALIWRAILSRLGSPLDLLTSERIYLSAEFVRYIPGNVWHVIARVLMAERRGVPKTVGFASMVVELATKIASAVLVFALTLFFWSDAHALTTDIPRSVLAGAGALGVPLLLVGLYPRLLNALLARGLRLMKREPIQLTLHYRDVLAIVAYWLLSWVLVGSGLYLLVRAIETTALPQNALALCIGIYAIAWATGFLSFITPGGLGFREWAIALLLGLAGLAPVAALAVAVALIARLLATAAELLCVSVAYAFRRRVAGPLPADRPALEPGAVARGETP